MSDYKNPRPLPSASASDPCVVYDNSVSFDKLINESEVVTTYKGVKLQSVPSLLEQIESEANAAVISLGWHQVGLFADGFTYTLQNDIAKDAAGDWYRWNGALPKVVTAGTLSSSDANFVKIDYKSHLQFTDTDAPNSHPASAISNDFGVSSEDFMNNILTAESFGTLRNTATLQAAVDAAISSGKKVLTVNDNWSVGEITNKGQVSFIGNGSISGLYRKCVAKLTDPILTSFNDINPDVNLKRFLSKNNPVVVIVGDSLGTDEGGDVPQSSTLFSRIKSKLTSSYPDKNISFFNRSIGGETYFTAVGLPSSFPVWYTDNQRGWPRYVGDLNPDLIIFNFGMNDSYGFRSSVLDTYQGYLDIAGIFPAGRPDVIYCSNLTPSIDSPIGDFATEIGQSGRDFVAGFTRTYSKAIGAGLLDFHRQCCIVKDGFDPTDTALEKVGNITPINGAVNSQTLCTDFKWELTLTIPVNTNLSVKLGYEETTDSSGRGAFVVIGNAGGQLSADFYATPTDNYKNFTGLSSVPTGSFTLTVEKKQGSCTLLINGTQVLFFGKLRCAGKDFIPVAGDSTYQAGLITSAVFWVGRYKTYKQSIVNNDMWGEHSAVVSTREPFGGNGVNHPSTLGCSAVYQPVLDACNFAGSPSSAITAPLVFVGGWSQQVGFSESVVSKVGNVVTLFFAATPPSSGATGVMAIIPEGFRPKNGLVSNALAFQATGDPIIAQVKYTGDFEIYTGVTGYCWGQVSFEV